MPYWQLDNGMRNSPSFPWQVIGRDLMFQMTFVNDLDEPWNHAYFFVAEADIGRVYAKLATDTDYCLVSRICNPECFVGQLLPGNTLIDFRITSLPIDRGVRYFGIPIYLAHDDGVFLPNRMFGTTWAGGALWGTCWANSELWWTGWKKTEGPCALDALPEGLWNDQFVPVWKEEFAPVWSD